MSERTEREIQADLDEELNEEEQLAIDEAVAASDDDTVVPRGRGSFPLVPLREIVIFPEMVAPLKVGRDKSVAAIRAAAAAYPIFGLFPGLASSWWGCSPHRAAVLLWAAGCHLALVGDVVTEPDPSPLIAAATRSSSG